MQEKYKRMKKIVLIGVTELIIIIGFAVLFRNVYNNSIQELIFTQEQIEEIDNNGNNQFYVDSSIDGYENKRLGIHELILDKGTYNVEISYESQGEVELGIEYENKVENYILGGWIRPSSLKRSQEQEIYISRRGEPIEIFCRLTSGEYLIVRQIKVEKTFTIYQLYLFWIIAGIVMLDLGFYIKTKQISMSRESRISVGGIIGITAIVCIPLFQDNLFTGHDITFHLLRIEGLKEGILRGQLPVRIQSNWLNGHGYPASIFYGDFFLYFPAVLRIIGFSLQNSYKAYLVLINGMTASAAYYSFRGIAKGNRIAGLLSSAFYTLSLYRICNLYTRGAVGEYTAMVFFPLILYGLWFILTQDTKIIERNNIWITLGMAYLGVLNSHIISCAIIGIFTILFCLLRIKNIFEKTRLVALLKAMLVLCFGGMSFLIPFLEYRRLDLVIGSSSQPDPYWMENRGLFGAQFFTTHYNVNAGSNGIVEGMRQEMALTLGAVFLVLVIAVAVIAVLFSKNVADKRELYSAIVLGIIFMWLCSKYFPYTELAQISEILGAVIKNIQFPWRFLTMVSLVGAWYITLLLEYVDWKEIGINYKKALVGTLGLLILIESTNMTGDVMNTNSPEMMLSEANLLPLLMTGVPEYLYEGVSFDDYIEEITDIETGLEIESWKRDGLKFEAMVRNTSIEEKKMELPLIYYPGYDGLTKDPSECLRLSEGKSHRIVVHIPGSYEGEIQVRYETPWYWRLAEVVSGITFIWLVLPTLDRRTAYRIE